MLRHALAPVVARAAADLGIPRTLAEPGVALTFDDGPHPQGTPAVLSVLEAADMRGTFFMVGEQVERRPELAAEVAARGHVVALHGYRHHLQLRMTPSQVRTDIARGLDVLTDALGTRPDLHRPPYGVYSPAGLRSVRAAGLRPLLWSRWGKDWRRYRAPQSIAALALQGISAGDVVLLHDADYYSARDSYRRTVQALELIIAELAARRIATVLPV